MLFQPLVHTKLHHFPEQFPRHWLIVRQVEGASGMGQLAETFREGIDGILTGMEAHMFLFRREMDKVALQHEGGDPPGDFFRNIRMTAVNQRPKGNHSFLKFAVICGDIFVNALTCAGHKNSSLPFHYLITGASQWQDAVIYS